MTKSKKKTKTRKNPNKKKEKKNPKNAELCIPPDFLKGPARDTEGSRQVITSIISGLG